MSMPPPLPGPVSGQARGRIHAQICKLVRVPERHTTPASVKAFFDPERYRPQKRSAGGDCGQRLKMTKSELAERFRLAAKMNGYQIEDITAPRLFD